MKYYEVNFDGLVGPSHNYAGLAHGNMASTKNSQQISNPKKAALQGLEKMKRLKSLGLQQAILPPQQRPHIKTLKRLGFTGNDEAIITKCAKIDPILFNQVCSAASMWTANAATVSPSPDTEDGRVHFTPANLTHNFHRSIEAEQTHRVFKKIFSDPAHFVVHDPLPHQPHFGDEGGANHTRLCASYDQQGVELFVFGKYAFQTGKPYPKHFPARQTYEASKTVTRFHGLDPDYTRIVQQNPLAIDNGVFHNDVIAVGNQHCFMYHEQGFFQSPSAIDELANLFLEKTGMPLSLIKVSPHEITLGEAVQTYLFNSQLVTLENNQMALLCPSECQEHKVVYKFIEKIIGLTTNPITKVHFFDLKQSMQNGGGPACLRLRVVLNEKELKSLLTKTLLTNEMIFRLEDWVERYYRDRLEPSDLGDPSFYRETCAALDELTQILELGSIYDFQR